MDLDNPFAGPRRNQMSEQDYQYEQQQRIQAFTGSSSIASSSSTDSKHNPDYENPFASSVRLNTLSEKEVLLRNERMVDPKLRFTSDMTTEDRNRISREYYLNLAKAQGLDKPSSSTGTSGSENTAIGEDDKLPFGWKLRTAGVNDAALLRRPEKTPPHDGGYNEEKCRDNSCAAPPSSTSTSTAAVSSTGSTSGSSSSGLNIPALLATCMEQISTTESDVKRLRSNMTSLREMAVNQATRTIWGTNTNGSSEGTAASEEVERSKEEAVAALLRRPEYQQMQSELKYQEQRLTQLHDKEMMLLGMLNK